VKTKLNNFQWKNKRGKIKRTGLYQDLEKRRDSFGSNYVQGSIETSLDPKTPLPGGGGEAKLENNSEFIKMQLWCKTPKFFSSILPNILVFHR